MSLFDRFCARLDELTTATRASAVAEQLQPVSLPPSLSYELPGHSVACHLCRILPDGHIVGATQHAHFRFADGMWVDDTPDHRPVTGWDALATHWLPAGQLAQG